MADIQFNEPTLARPAPIPESRGLIALVQRLGLAKNDTQANYVLLGIVFGIIILTVGVWVGSSHSDQSTVTPSEDRTITDYP